MVTRGLSDESDQSDSPVAAAVCGETCPTFSLEAGYVFRTQGIRMELDREKLDIYCDEIVYKYENENGNDLRLPGKLPTTCCLLITARLAELRPTFSREAGQAFRTRGLDGQIVYGCETIIRVLLRMRDRARAKNSRTFVQEFKVKFKMVSFI
jgi:hypothetical protein